MSHWTDYINNQEDDFSERDKIQELREYLIGKFVIIWTKKMPININQEEMAKEYFSGILADINEKFITIRKIHENSKDTMNIFFTENVLMIEEMPYIETQKEI